MLPGIPLVVILCAFLLYLVFIKGVNVTLCTSTIIVLIINNYRKDRKFLRYIIGIRMRHIVYAIEYMAVCTPFIALMAIQEAWIQIATNILIVCLTPFIGGIKSNRILPTNRLYLKGSYNYQRTYRVLFPLHLISFVICLVGSCIANNNLAIVASGIWAFIYVVSLFSEKREEEVFHYSSPRRYLFMSVCQALVNTFVVLLPFGVVLQVSDASWTMTYHLISAYLAFSLMALNVEFSRWFYISIGPLVGMLVLAAYLAMTIASIAMPWALLPYSLIAVGLALANVKQMYKKLL